MVYVINLQFAVHATKEELMCEDARRCGSDEIVLKCSKNFFHDVMTCHDEIVKTSCH